MTIHDNSGELRWFPYDQYHIKDVRTAPYSPDMNAYAERFVRSIRRECLDYFIIFTQGQLRRIIKSYIGVVRKLQFLNNFLIKIAVLQAESRKTARLVRQPTRLSNKSIDYYNNYRPHQGLKGIPNGPPEQGPKTGRIKQKRLLFGLHNHYYREIA